MEWVCIWYLTDNEEGENVAILIKELGLQVQLLKKDNFQDENILPDKINLFIIDFKQRALSEIISLIKEDRRIHDYLKYVIISKKEINKAMEMTTGLMRVEFISRPISYREFILLIEKSVIVERYKEIMSYLSRDMGSMISTYENMMDIQRKDIFVSDKEKEAFGKILEYEKRLMFEQIKLNKAIEKFTLTRQSEMFDLKNRIGAEEKLEELRRKELLDANSVIRAQESIIDFSSKKLIEANMDFGAVDKLEELRTKERVDANSVIRAQESVIDFSSMKLYEAIEVIDAVEKVAELGRSEAIQLHEELNSKMEENKRMSEEIRRLKDELKILKEM